jgi:hypothetical protein
MPPLNALLNVPLCSVRHAQIGTGDLIYTTPYMPDVPVVQFLTTSVMC